MGNRIKLAIQLLMNMGIRYVMFRVYFEFQKRTGQLKKKFPINPPKKDFISLEEWKINSVFLIEAREEWDSSEYPFEPSSEITAQMMKGTFEFFSSTKYNLGENYNWITNPDTGFVYDPNLHWSDINDYNQKSGDIKYVWEKSRFSFVYAFIRDDIKNGTDHSAFIFNEIKSWIKANPINQGPNYKCSQEISLRVINWTYALHFYRNSKNLDKTLFSEIMHVIYWQLKHVRSNIHFSRIAVRNNHAITETLMLYLGGKIYSFYPESPSWVKKGKAWFEQEVKYQVYPDGTFLQFSMNYHRVLIQLFNLAFIVSDKFKEKFEEEIYQRAYASLNFLFHCMQPSNGELPNYGANDGALFFPLTSCAYRDYRPQLNTLYFLLTGNILSEPGNWQEELSFYKPKPIKNFKPIFINQGWKEFKNGGYAVLRDGDTFTFIRCGTHKDRPSQADNLHIDIWKNGLNLLGDGGSYKYNTENELLKYFMGTESHNTIMLDDSDQMKKGARFIWYYWTKSLKFKASEDDKSYRFEGEISAFRHLNKKIAHSRIVIKWKDEDRWTITDSISAKYPQQLMRQIWHPISESSNLLIEENVEGEAITNIIQKKGWYSGKYGVKLPVHQIELQTNSNKISTTIRVKA